MSFGTNTSANDSRVSPSIMLLPKGGGETASGSLSAPMYSIISIVSISAMAPSDLPSTGPTPSLVENSQESNTLTYVLVILGVLLIVGAVVSLAIYLVKRNKLDRIRHHLMPLYNFDPTDEEPHWEADLLEDDRDQQMVLNITSSTVQPKLKFHSHGLDI